MTRIREGVRGSIDRIHGALKTAAYPTLTAFLCSSAALPIVAASQGAGITMTAAFGTVGAIGGNAISEIISTRLRRNPADGKSLSENEIRAVLTETFSEVLNSDAPEFAEARRDTACLLRESEAFETVVREALSSGHRDLLVAIKSEMAQLSGANGEMRALFVDMQDLLLDLCRTQAEVFEVQLSVRDTVQESLGVLVQMFQFVQYLGAGLEVGTVPGRAHWTGSPYRGLQPFKAKDAPIFFGRTVALAELVTRARASVPGGLMLVTGPSGVGKSSLLRAGLVPAVESGLLREDPEQGPWRVILLEKPGDDPLRALAIELAKHGGRDSAETYRSLEARPEEAGDRVEERRIGRDGERPERIILVIDQFEELFTLSEEPRRRRFLEALESVRRSPRAFVVIGVRSDYVDRCMAVPTLREPVQDHLYRVGPMTRGQMRQAATLPAAAVGMRIDDRVVETLLEELFGAEDAPKAPGAALPLLSQAMLLLWEEGRDDRRLSYEEYLSIGGVQNAVKTAAERVYESLDIVGKAAAERLFRCLVGAEQGERLVRRSLDRGAFGVEERKVAETFLKERLLVADEFTVEIAHDVLLEEWDRLRKWLEPDLKGRILLTQLEVDAEKWDQGGRDPSFLYRGARLAALETGGLQESRRTERGLEPSDRARAFIDLSRSRHRRGIRIRRALTGSLAGLTAVALVLAGVSYSQNQDLADQRNQAISQRLAAESIALRGVDGQLAQLVAAAAWELGETDEAHAALAQSVNDASIGRVSTDPVDGFETLVANSDGTQVATIGSTGAVRIWSTEDWTSFEIEREIVAEDRWGSLRFSPDGSVLAVETSGAIALWSEIGIDLIEVQEPADVAFSLDGAKIAVASGDGVGVWDLASEQEEARFGQGTSFDTVGFSADGTSLFAVDWDGRLLEASLATGAVDWGRPFGDRFVDTMWADGSEGRMFACAPEQCFSQGTGGGWTTLAPHRLGAEVSIAADGRAVVYQDRKMTISDLTTGDRSTFSAPSGQYNDIALIPGSLIVAAGTDSGIQLWDFGRIAPIDTVLMDGAPTMDQVQIAADSDRLIVSGVESMEVWETDDWRTGSAHIVREFPGALPGAISPDGQVAVIIDAADDGAPLQIVDLDTGDLLGAPPVDTTVVRMAFSPNGDRLAMVVNIGGAPATAAYEIWMWDLSTKELLFRTDPVLETTTSLGFDPGGERLAATHSDGTVSLLEADEGRLIDSFDSGANQPEGLAFSADGDSLAVATVAGLVVWRLEDGSSHLSDTGRIVGDFSFTPDGRFIVSMASGTGLRFWDLEREQWTAEINAGGSALFGAFLAGGWKVVTGQAPEPVVIDTSFMGDPYGAVCEQVRRDLTEEEWKTYLPEFKFEAFPICP